MILVLAAAKLGIEFFWEIKANLTDRQVRALRDAGVAYVQPGIESLNDHVLELMKKGTTSFRNIELLKWCKEYGIKPMWNLLYGFPGETATDYDETIETIHAIWHLDPPTGYGPIRLDRFSPYHEDPAAFGMVGVRPMGPFPFLYPFAHETVMEIAYYFDFDYSDGRTDDVYAADAVALTRSWMHDEDHGLLALQGVGRPDPSALRHSTQRQRQPAPRRADGLEGGRLRRLRPRADAARAPGAPGRRGRAGDGRGADGVPRPLRRQPAHGDKRPPLAPCRSPPARTGGSAASTEIASTRARRRRLRGCCGEVRQRRAARRPPPACESRGRAGATWPAGGRRSLLPAG